MKIILLLCMLISIGGGSPIPDGQDVDVKLTNDKTEPVENIVKAVEESSIKTQEQAAPYKRGCIPTPYGCIDISDPSFRPKVVIPGQGKCPCIPVPGWGCIDPCDPSIRP